MDDDYDASLDLGVAVKEAPAQKSSKKEKRKRRSASADGVPSLLGDGRAAIAPSTAADDGAKDDGNRSDEDGTPASVTGKKGRGSGREGPSDGDGMPIDGRSADEGAATGPNCNSDRGSTEPGDADAADERKRRKKTKKKKRRKERDIVGDGPSIANSPRAAAADGEASQSPPLPPLKGMFVKERSNLPVYQRRAEICKLVVATNDVVLVVAETVSAGYPMRT